MKSLSAQTTYMLVAKLYSRVIMIHRLLQGMAQHGMQAFEVQGNFASSEPIDLLEYLC